MIRLLAAFFIGILLISAAVGCATHHEKEQGGNAQTELNAYSEEEMPIQIQNEDDTPELVGGPEDAVRKERSLKPAELREKYKSNFLLTKNGSIILQHSAGGVGEDLTFICHNATEMST